MLLHYQAVITLLDILLYYQAVITLSVVTGDYYITSCNNVSFGELTINHCRIMWECGIQRGYVLTLHILQP